VRKLFIFCLFLLATSDGFSQTDLWERAHRYTQYTLGLAISNPLSVMSKYGGELEYKKSQWSYTFGFYKRVGFYQGKQYDVGLRYYMNKEWRHIRNKWTRRDFFYSKLLVGGAEYRPTQYTYIGLPLAYDLVYYEYIGISSGIGRKYHHGPFFISVKGGLKATYLGLEEEDKLYYRLFHITGPGAIAEVNLNLGIEF